MENSELTGKRLLVTGGAGFVGSNLCEYFLSKGNHVRCLDNLSTGRKENIEGLMQNEDFEFVHADITDYAACEAAVANIDIIFHQAALGSVPRSIENPLAANANNITGFLNMLTAAKEAGIKRFVYAASSSTYGDHTALPKVEDQIGRPLSPYAVTKYVNELYASVFSDLYGIETIGLRYFNVFGRRQDPEGAYAAVIPKFVDMMLRGESPTINGDGEQTRDFTYIDNVIQANEKAALATESEALNTVYNVAFGESATLNSLVEDLRELLEPFKPGVSGVPFNYGPERVGDIRDSLASINKAKTMLGYAPKFNLRQGLELALNYYVESASQASN